MSEVSSANDCPSNLAPGTRAGAVAWPLTWTPWGQETSHTAKTTLLNTQVSEQDAARVVRHRVPNLGRERAVSALGERNPFFWRCRADGGIEGIRCAPVLVGRGDGGDGIHRGAEGRSNEVRAKRGRARRVQ